MNYRVSVFGESHGNAIGVLLDGVPAGIGLSEQDFLADIDRRRSGAKGTTPRKETDMPEILSGVYEGHTTGAPLALIFRNGNTRSHDYDRFRDVPRPGHADFVAGLKWKGFNDPRGGGHFSGRLTLPFVAAGVVAKRILTAAGILKSGDGIRAGLAEVGGISANEPEYLSLWDDALDKAAAEGDSLGGIVRCVIEGLPAGIGEPFFCSVESMISQAVFSIICRDERFAAQRCVRFRRWEMRIQRGRRDQRRHYQRQSGDIQGGIQADIEYKEVPAYIRFQPGEDDGS